MKLLIAYDGSHCAEAALDDLATCALPAAGEAMVVTVAEAWLPPPNSLNKGGFLEPLFARHAEKGKRILNEAETMANHAAYRVKKSLPSWNVEHLATYGSPGREILRVADELDRDLIIVGSHGHSVLGRLLLGSTSQKVLTEARCSVRIARGRVEVDPAPGRIIVGFDGSRGANAAVDIVRSRKWPADTELKLIAAASSVVPAEIARFTPSVGQWAEVESKKEHYWIERMLEHAAESLSDTHLITKYEIVEGNPHDVLVREAANWHADCIFLGANVLGSRFEQFLLGSTSAAIAARAGCSVEVVRIANPEN